MVWVVRMGMRLTLNSAKHDESEREVGGTEEGGEGEAEGEGE